jgi:SAM-dependent methyltransferase
VLDLACGYGEFINNIRAARKIAVDLNPDSPDAVAGDVIFHAVAANALGPITDASVDVVFTSNFFEHLPDKAALQEVLGEVLSEKKIHAPIRVPRGVELSVRAAGATEFLFVINHTADTCEVNYGEWSGQDLLTGKSCAGQMAIEPYGVRIVPNEKTRP